MKTKQIIYWTPSVLLTLMMLVSGFFYTLQTTEVAKEFMALSAHLSIGDGEYAPAIIALILLSISYKYKDQVRT